MQNVNLMLFLKPTHLAPKTLSMATQ